MCRWLLLAADRLDGNVIPLTHDQLSMILGVRRAGVTTALAKLYEDGAVIKTRGTVEIVDRAVLEKKTCQCYRIISSEYKRMTEVGSQRYTIEKIPPASGRLGRAA